MDKENMLTDFTEFLFPKEKFAVEMAQLTDYIRNSCTLQSTNAKNKLAKKELEEKIAANAVTEEQLLNELNGKESDIRRMKKELQTMEMQEEKVKRAQQIILSAIKNHEDMLIKDADEVTIAANCIEDRLGFKLKLTQHDIDDSIWCCNFIFDPKNEISQQFVTVDFDLNQNQFKLIDMKPKPRRFIRMTKFLDHTNDITGLLYTYFEKFCANEPKM